MCINCNRLELFVCCSSLCSARLCKKCYDTCSIDDVTTIDPADHVIDDGNVCEDNDGTDDEGNIDNSFVVGTRGDQGDDDNDDESNGSNNTGDQFAYDDEGDEDDVCYDPDLLLFNDSDATHEITQDNIVKDHGFFTTNAGDSCRDVLHHDRMERVSGMLFSTRPQKDMEGHNYLARSNKGTLFNVLRLLHLIAQAHCSTWSLHCSFGSSSPPPSLINFLSLVPYPCLRTARSARRTHSVWNHLLI